MGTGRTVPLSCTKTSPCNGPENPNQCLYPEVRNKTIHSAFMTPPPPVPTLKVGVMGSKWCVHA